MLKNPPIRLKIVFHSAIGLNQFQNRQDVILCILLCIQKCRLAFQGFSPTFNSLQKSSSLPTSESLTQLLTQAVASGDGKLLEEVLRVHKEKIIRATIRRLPVTVVLPFLRKVVQNTVASLLF